MNASPRHTLVAAVIVRNSNHDILLIRGAKRGWEIPAGRVEEGESITAAAVREAREETGIDIEIIKYCGLFQHVRDSVCTALFIAKPIGGMPQTSEESDEVGFYSVEEARSKITWPGFRDQIDLCLNQEEPFMIEFHR
ncbi:NUDIX hydrolase [Paenibacillus sp. NAIST15-1]|uniref:NUDIX hydrolase n=1 Tax=Paenibacillus sp. NAIST15-1 TaxID=1605994 RepID=UPI000869BD66|nr:NUDIX hydrolase [Paenibacillus sp. NAIST15-1]GAV11815.1 hypothetical protein PBN151_1744 [Paenibacillus sp. NAIST15-1]